MARSDGKTYETVSWIIVGLKAQGNYTTRLISPTECNAHGKGNMNLRPRRKPHN